MIKIQLVCRSALRHTYFMFNLIPALGIVPCLLIGLRQHLSRVHPHGPRFGGRFWNREGLCPEDLTDLGEEVWSPRGVRILGTPVGSSEFLRALGEERRLWEAIGWVPDLQCAWQILLQCAGPRCHHFVRTLPPSESQSYAEGRAPLVGRAHWKRLAEIRGAPGVATLPKRSGGLGRRLASLMPHAG